MNAIDFALVTTSDHEKWVREIGFEEPLTHTERLIAMEISYLVGQNGGRETVISASALASEICSYRKARGFLLECARTGWLLKTARHGIGFDHYYRLAIPFAIPLEMAA
ncbi:hypothetical protein ACFWAR_27890 [Streptomyces sp. NPDC059917]|uniref:hypothetical protein n=1 Tax=Streptomyces sp. NPDC059917 TaxID=3347002 RepID=UPI0036678BA7